MDKSTFETLKENLHFIHSFSRNSRHAGVRVIGFSEDMDKNAEWLIVKTLQSMKQVEFEDCNLEIFSVKQQQELLKLSSYLLTGIVHLPKSRLKDMSGLDTHNILSSGS